MVKLTFETVLLIQSASSTFVIVMIETTKFSARAVPSIVSNESSWNIHSSLKIYLRRACAFLEIVVSNYNITSYVGKKPVPPSDVYEKSVFSFAHRMFSVGSYHCRLPLLKV